MIGFDVFFVLSVAFFVLGTWFGMWLSFTMNLYPESEEHARKEETSVVVNPLDPESGREPDQRATTL
jgi:hypothetical protein